MKAELGSISITTVLTDLSDVLIGGIIGLDDVIAVRYGENVSREFSKRFRDNYPNFNDLMRGVISEEEYWELFSRGEAWSDGFSTSLVRELFVLNMQKVVPNTFDLYRKLLLPSGQSPKYYIVSDHIREYSRLVENWHRDIFKWADKVFWSYDCGNIKRDEGFFTNFLRNNELGESDVIFIDDSDWNIENAESSGILSFHFDNAERLESELVACGFSFR